MELFILLFVVILLLLVYGVICTDNIHDLGIMLIIFGIFFGWVWAVIGAVLVTVYYCKEKNNENNK